MQISGVVSEIHTTHYDFYLGSVVTEVNSSFHRSVLVV